MSIDHGKVLAGFRDRIDSLLTEIDVHAETENSHKDDLLIEAGELVRELSTALASAQPAEAVLDRPARVAGRDFHPGQPVQQVIGRANAHYDATHDAAQGDGRWPATKEEMEAYWEAYSAHRVHGEGEAIRAGLAAYQALRAAAPSQEGE